MERGPSLTLMQRRDPGHSLEPTPHTRVDEESAIGRKYSIGEVLGQGTFGVVREVTNRLTGLQYAMKVVNKDKVSVVSSMTLTQSECIAAVELYKHVAVATPVMVTDGTMTFLFAYVRRLGHLHGFARRLYP